MRVATSVIVPVHSVGLLLLSNNKWAKEQYGDIANKGWAQKEGAQFKQHSSLIPYYYYYYLLKALFPISPS